MANEREVAELREKLVAAREIINEQAAELERLAESPLVYASVLNVGKKRVTLARESGGVVEVKPPEKIKLKRGDAVLCASDGGGIIEKANAVLTGEIAAVQRIVSDDEAEVSFGSGTRIVLRPEGLELREGDKAVLDATGRLILRTLARTREHYDMTVDTGVTWQDIGGQEEAKAQMVEAVELPLKRPTVLKFYNAKPIKGVLLYGPPGCGKTMLGKAAATAIASANGAGASGFMYVKGPEVLDPYVGVAEATVRSLFQRARAHKAEHGSPALIFIDEADALLGNRNDRHAHMEKTIVPTFLAEMDGLEDSGALVVLATNRPDSLDPAIVRDGRIDRKVCVSRPTTKDAEDIFRLSLRNVPLSNGATAEEIAAAATRAVFNENRAFYHVRLDNGDERPFTLAGLVSGAMIVGIVNQAVSRAMQRDMASEGAPQGLCIEDVLNAVEHVYEQNRDVDHTEAVLHLADGRKVTNIIKRSTTHVSQAA